MISEEDKAYWLATCGLTDSLADKCGGYKETEVAIALTYLLAKLISTHDDPEYALKNHCLALKQMVEDFIKDKK